MSVETVVPAHVRSQRLSSGRCPEHGSVLTVKGPMLEAGLGVGTIYRCPTEGCIYTIDARTGSRMDKLLRR